MAKTVLGVLRSGRPWNGGIVGLGAAGRPENSSRGPVRDLVRYRLAWR